MAVLCRFRIQAAWAVAGRGGNAPRRGEGCAMAEMRSRPRRNRARACIRDAVRESTICASHLVLPMFVLEGEALEEPIDVAQEAEQLGICGVALFPCVPDEKKTKRAEESMNPDGLLQRAIRALAAATNNLLIISDVAMDPYSSDGHDGYVTEEGVIDNDTSVEILCGMAVAQAHAGAHMVAPSDMMDGRIGRIRDALDDAGFSHVAIMSYSTKYCSSFYGPFRQALDSAPRGGDKKTYQMDPGNRIEARREALLDEKEAPLLTRSKGADWLMVKPGLPYLDIVREVRDAVTIPIAIYHVSGEYAMLKAAAQNGWIDYDSCLLEALLCARRAGASIIFTYGALDAARLLRNAANRLGGRTAGARPAAGRVRQLGETENVYMKTNTQPIARPRLSTAQPTNPRHDNKHSSTQHTLTDSPPPPTPARLRGQRRHRAASHNSKPLIQ